MGIAGLTLILVDEFKQHRVEISLNYSIHINQVSNTFRLTSSKLWVSQTSLTKTE